MSEASLFSGGYLEKPNAFKEECIASQFSKVSTKFLYFLITFLFCIELYVQSSIAIREKHTLGSIFSPSGEVRIVGITTALSRKSLTPCRGVIRQGGLEHEILFQTELNSNLFSPVGK